MSRVPASLGIVRHATVAAPPTGSTPARESSDLASRERLVRRIGVGVLALQGIGLLAWNAFEFSRVVEQTDFAGYFQAWFLIAHGHLNPHLTVWGNTAFIHVHGELILWLLAPLWWIAPSGLTLLWLQDVALVVAEAAVFLWMVECAFARWPRQSDTGRSAGAHRAGGSKNGAFPPQVLSVIGLLLLVANPWIYWSVSFDFHSEVLGTAFIALAAYDLAHHRRRYWLWIALTLISGDVASTYVAGLGLSALLAGPAWRRKGLGLVGLGVGVTAVITAVGANAGSGLQAFESPAAKSAEGPGSLGSLFASPFQDPGHFFRGLWPDRLNMWANLAPAGAIGIASAWGFGVPALVLIENNLTGPRFSLTSFQNLPVYIFVSLGTVMVLQRLARWRPKVTVVVAVVVLASTIGWFVTWFPKTASTWTRVSPSAAATIHRGLDGISSSAEVVAAHGVVGALSGRRNVAILGPLVPIHSREVYFVTAPTQGIEVDPVSYAIGQTAAVADLGSRLVASGGGVWVFEWTPPSGMTDLHLGVTCCEQPAWALSTAVGRDVTSGPPREWRVTAQGASGYVVYGDYWPEPTGHYLAKVQMSASAPVNVEVWNATANTLLARRTITSTNGRAEVDLPFVFDRVVPIPTRYAGTGPFRTDPLPSALQQNQLEVRVWTSGAAPTDVFSVDLAPA